MQTDAKYWMRRMGQDSLSFLLVITIASFFGLAFNQFLDNSLALVYQPKEQRIGQEVANLNAREIRSQPLAPATAVHLPEVHDDALNLADFRSFIAHKRGIVIDARPAVFYEDSHIPGALSLPRDDFEASYNKIKSVLESDKTRPLAVYCSSSACPDSELVQRGLILLGYTNVFRFTGGIIEWTRAKLPVVQAP